MSEPARQQKPKWRRRAESRPDEILDAALTIFERDGFDAARVEDIAKAANLSKAGVYLYFETKDAILRGLIEREVAPVARNFRAMAEAGVEDPVASLRMIVAGFTELAGDKRKFAVPRLVLSVASRYPDLAVYYRENVVEQGLGAVKGLVAAGMEQGVFRPCDPGAAARALLGPIFIHGFYTHFLHGDPGPLGAAERVEAHTDILLNGLMAPQ
ncbi:TetR/AcrR family transcriptional regulator [Hyphococcus luteus]|uniref:TetR family transcriptional regulator n=1 Tax=Hyphococcus luteus TaxID=2058213 RepID=A0A2S7K948_9PROT|nr:TetR/AcrR family transcriptional regulator [Marinicaulis flavus]PQA89026.1 TetR family transcriptional regulator [Marinicaulis flavus]